MWSTLNLAPRRKSSRWSWESLACMSGLASGFPDWPLAAHSAPAPAPAATPASAAACFRKRLRPDPLESMIASSDPEVRLSLNLGEYVFADQLCSFQGNRQRVNRGVLGKGLEVMRGLGRV